MFRKQKVRMEMNECGDKDGIHKEVVFCENGQCEKKDDFWI